MEIKQYQVYWINLDPTIGSEIKKTRPCLIISPDELNQHLNTIIVAPLTTNIRNYPSRVKCILLGKNSSIVLDQIRTVDKRRLIGFIDTISATEIKRVKDVIEEMLVK